MTLKSPFYNKPSTSTSVDSCHKCPAISPMINKDFNVPDEEFAKNLKVSQVQLNDHQHQHQHQQQKMNHSFGFDQRLSETSNNNNMMNNNNNNNPSTTTTTTTNIVVDPCNSRVTKLDNGNNSLTSCSNCGTTSTPLWRRSPQGETICNACGLYLKARNTTRPPWLKRNANNKRPAVPSMPVALAPAPIAMKLPIHTLPNLVPIQKMPITITTSSSSSTNNNNNNNTLSSSSLDDDEKENNDDDLDKSTTDGNRNMICFNCNTNTTPLWRRDGDGNTICNACGLYYKLHNVHRPITMKRSIIKRRKRVAIPATMTTSNNNNNNNNNNEMIGLKRKSSIDHHDFENEQQSSIKRMELPLLAAKLPSTNNIITSSSSNNINDNVKPVEPDAFQYRHHSYQLPSPPLQPIKSSNLANLLNPSTNDDDNNNEKEKQSSHHQLPSISLPSLPSPPLVAYDHHQRRSISLSPPPMSPNSTTSSSSSSSDQNLYESNNNSNNNAVAAAAAAAFATVSALLNPNANRQQTQKMLEAHRHELQREVSNLTTMLSRTTAMLENLDQVMAVTSNRDN